MGKKGISSKQRLVRLVLIDGNAILHRAYHALPPLTTKTGQLVNAAYGFTSMLLKVIADLQPTHLIVCFDRPEPTFRKKIYVAYQAQRPKMEEELVSQLELVKKVVRAMEIPIYELAGYEADDLIGTLVKQTLQKARSKEQKAKSSEEVIIVTGDRDILQLVSDKVKVYMPVKGLSQAKLYGVAEVEEKYGVSPEQIVDYKALVGDPSDNYPGVAGVGPKTASRLLQEFGSLEKIYQVIGTNSSKRIKKRTVKALAENVRESKMAKKLAEIIIDAPVSLELEKARLEGLDRPKVRELFTELEFKSLIPRLGRNKAFSKMDRQKKQKKKHSKGGQLTFVILDDIIGSYVGQD